MGIILCVEVILGVDIDSSGKCIIDGKSYPAVGFGTYPFKGTVCANAVADAAICGYRIIDTATLYGNFDGVYQGLQGLDRSQFYIISKVWQDSLAPERVRQDIQETLKQLHTNYLDAYLIHWPNSEIPIEDTLSTMNELRQKGLIRHIGVSNFTINHLKRALELNIPIVWDQVEMSPYFYDPDLLNFCKEHQIAVQAWGPLGRGRIGDDQMLADIGKKYGKTASQIALRWITQHGVLPLPGSQNKAHIEDNLAIFDFILTQEEMKMINEQAKQGKRERYSKAQYGFWDEFDYTYEQCWPKKQIG